MAVTPPNLWVARSRLQAEAGPAGPERTGRETVPTGPVLLSGYSYGSAIASAVIAQLPPGARRCRLADAGLPGAAAIRAGLPRLFWRRSARHARGNAGRGWARRSDGWWKNLCRRSDNIGSWVLHDPEPRSDRAYLPATWTSPAGTRWPWFRTRTWRPHPQAATRDSGLTRAPANLEHTWWTCSNAGQERAPAGRQAGSSLSKRGQRESVAAGRGQCDQLISHDRGRISKPARRSALSRGGETR
jgi:hypothetical protein